MNLQHNVHTYHVEQVTILIPPLPIELTSTGATSSGFWLGHTAICIGDHHSMYESVDKN